jgi:DNA invertase Pin-like site-specific DNA recombinase
MKKVFGYIRVSDQKQVDGASLSEQERAINEYATRNNLVIAQWFKETKTAAKRGRPQFSTMMTQLKKGTVSGVIIHKIDRSARNLHDWAALGDLIDNGIDVHFAHESLDMTERSGRLSADIQAVMAADYVRNLRQEALKGLYGRLNQGIYPFRAPIGYLNCGKGKLKTVDERFRNLIVKLFELYVNEDHSIHSLVPVMKGLGLRNLNGKPLCKNSIVQILKNPFYTGLMKVKGMTYEGKHEAIISPELFRKAQRKIQGNRRSKGSKYQYLFQGLIKCHLCGRSMIAELQKNKVYYRCQNRECLTKTIREDFAEKSFVNFLKQIDLPKNELELFSEAVSELVEDTTTVQQKIRKGIKLNIHQLEQKEEKLLNAFLDNLLDRDEYQNRKGEIKHEIADLKYRIERIDEEYSKIKTQISSALELCKSPINIYNSGTEAEKRSLVKMLASNFTAYQRKLVISPLFPYSEIINRENSLLCALKRDNSRTSLPKVIRLDKETPLMVGTLIQRLVYSNTNTSAFTPNILTKEQWQRFAEQFIEKIRAKIKEEQSHE